MNTKLSLEEAIDLIVSCAEAIRTEASWDGNQDTIKSSIKSRLFDETIVEKNVRQVALKAINKRLGTTYSMTQIRNAASFTVNPFQANETAAVPGPLVPVDEIHGTVEVSTQETLPGPAQQAVGASTPIAADVVPNTEDDSSAKAVVAEVTEHIQVASVEIQPQSNAQISLSSEKETDMAIQNTAQTTQAQAQDAGAIGGFTPEQIASANRNAEGYFGFAGITVADGLKFFSEYLETAPEKKAEVEGIRAASPGTPEVCIFAKWMDRDPGNSLVMMNFLRQKAQESAAAATVTGDRNEGIQTSWIAAGAAIVGGGLEMMARGGVSVSSVVGTAAATTASWFASKLIDDNIEGDFGRWVAGGAMGLALGAGGSAVGRSLLGGLDRPQAAPVVIYNNDVPTGVVPGL